MKTRMINIAILAFIALLSCPLLSNAGIRTIDMSSDVSESDASAVTSFYINSQQMRDLADVHGNCLENPQEPGQEVWDPRTYTPDKLYYDADWTDPNSRDNGRHSFVAMLASSPTGGNGNRNNNSPDPNKTPKTPENPDNPLPPAGPTGPTDVPVTPEPATMFLIGAGMIALPFARRFRRV